MYIAWGIRQKKASEYQTPSFLESISYRSILFKNYYAVQEVLTKHV